jgi:hypothetical protein
MQVSGQDFIRWISMTFLSFKGLILGLYPTLITKCERYNRRFHYIGINFLSQQEQVAVVIYQEGDRYSLIIHLTITYLLYY